jgi:hypothetical protein
MLGWFLLDRKFDFFVFALRAGRRSLDEDSCFRGLAWVDGASLVCRRLVDLSADGICAAVVLVPAGGRTPRWGRARASLGSVL